MLNVKEKNPRESYSKNVDRYIAGEKESFRGDCYTVGFFFINYSNVLCDLHKEVVLTKDLITKFLINDIWK